METRNSCEEHGKYKKSNGKLPGNNFKSIRGKLRKYLENKQKVPRKYTENTKKKYCELEGRLPTKYQKSKRKVPGKI